MLQPETRIFAGTLPLQALIYAQRHVDPRIAVGMSPDLPAREMRLTRMLIQLVLSHDLNAVVMRSSYVGLAEPRGALGDGAVGNQLHGADAAPVVSKAGPNT